MNFTLTKIAAAAALAFASTSALAVPVTTDGVFNMYSQKGLDQNPGNINPTGPVNVDNTITGFVDQAAGTWGVSSSTLFFGLPWTASGGVLYETPGTYALDTATNAVTPAAPDFTGTADGSMHFTVAAGQIAGSINFAYGTTTGIRVVDVWNVNSDGSLTGYSIPGMENGPFPGFNAQFNLTSPGLVTLVPEASTYGMMLAGLGLVGGMVARRRKLMA